MLRGLLLLLLLNPVRVQGQTTSIDSLYMVRHYLLQIRNTVNSGESASRKLDKLNVMVRSADRQKNVFSRSVRRLVGDVTDVEQLISSLNFVLQSLVLYRSDLKGNHTGRSELVFLNRNIPILVYKIDLYCKGVRIRLEENTH